MRPNLLVQRSRAAGESEDLAILGFLGSTRTVLFPASAGGLS